MQNFVLYVLKLERFHEMMYQKTKKKRHKRKITKHEILRHVFLGTAFLSTTNYYYTYPISFSNSIQVHLVELKFQGKR